MLARLHARPALASVLAALVLATPAGATPQSAARDAVSAWTQLAPMPVPRYLLGAATAPDGRVFAIGGFPSDGGNASAEVDAYDPATNAWSVAAPLPTPLIYVSAATGSDGRIYVVGTCFDCTVAAFAYDQHSNAWTQLPLMLSPRFGMKLAAGHDGRIYAIGGFDAAQNASSEVDAYTPATNAWTQVAPLPAPRSDAAVTVGLDGTIYAIGGDSHCCEGSPLASVVAYDPQTDRWTSRAPLPRAIDKSAATTAANGRIYLTGGQIFKPATRTTGTLNTVEVYDPPTATWRSGPKLPARRFYHVSVTSGAQILVVGGRGTGRHLADTLALQP
jgi:N-acetylneuraminic acid mutarotase